MSQTAENPTKTDLAPTEIWEVMLDNSTIKFHEPLVLQTVILPPESPTDRIYLVVEHPELAISSYGVNLEELELAVRSDISFAWRHFVQADDTILAPDAKAVKENYLAVAEEING